MLGNIWLKGRQLRGKSKQSSNNDSPNPSVSNNPTADISLSIQICLYNNPNYWYKMEYFIPKLYLPLSSFFTIVEGQGCFPVSATLIVTVSSTTQSCACWFLVVSVTVLTTAKFFLYLAFLLISWMYPGYLWRQLPLLQHF